MTLYVQTSGTQSTGSSSWTPIPGLGFTIAEGVGVTAIIVLNVPNPYSDGLMAPGGNFGIEVDGKLSAVIAGYSYTEQTRQASGRVPTTLVVGVPLINKPQQIKAVWAAAHESNIVIDSPASLTAIFS